MKNLDNYRMIANKSKNWLLILGIITALVCAVLYIFIGSDQPYEGSRNYSDKSLRIMLFAAIIFAPLLEEIAFRGFFTGKKWVRIASFVILPLFVFEGLASGEWFIILPTVLFIATYLLSLKIKDPVLINCTIIFNVLLFASVHYTVDDLFLPNYYYVPLSQISAGCFLVWITINFNLFKAMLFHFIWNASMMLLLIYGLQFPDTEIKTFSNDIVSIEWVEVPIFDSGKTQVSVKEDLIEGTNVEARWFYKIIAANQTPDTRILQQDPYVKYNFRVKYLNPNASVDLLKYETLEFLETQKLVYLKEKE